MPNFEYVENDEEMVEVSFVDLSEWGIQPERDRVRMVIAQPHVPIDAFTHSEPYRLVGAAKTRQLDIVKRTLDVACMSHGMAAKTQFTILPEYSIPGLEGVALVEKRLRDDSWPSRTVLIGGLDGLSKQEYSQLVNATDTYHDIGRNGVDCIKDDQWVNSAITWVKCLDGRVKRWVQPKLWPAWPEQSGESQRMFRGRCIYLFRGQRANGEPFIFGTLVCFDWIAPHEPRVYERILAETQKEAKDAQLPLTWLFVIQHNKRPSHLAFLNNVVSFFGDRSHPNATRIHTCIVFANTAGLEQPGHCATFGSTSLILSPSAGFDTSGTTPTASHQGFRFREENASLLQSAQCKDVFFRERGECIHAFDQINPSWLVPGPAGRSRAIEDGRVHGAEGAGHLLAAGGAVPAVVKWVNDKLDQVTDALPRHAAGLRESLQDAHAAVVAALRRVNADAMTAMVRLSAEGAGDEIDAWDAMEVAGLEHVLCTLRILAAGDRLRSVGESMGHGVVAFRDGLMDVVAICGNTHEACIEQFRERYKGPGRGALLLVSKDVENTSWDPRHGSILAARSVEAGSEGRFTDVGLPTFHMSYQDILRLVSRAEALEDIDRGIEASGGK